MANDCIFCAIVERKINSTILFETEKVIAFNDINKASEVHVLIIPKNHISSVSEISEENAHIMAELTLAAKQLAVQLGVIQSGYRLVINTGRDAQQSVFHLHMHLLAGRSFSWPPG